MTRHDARRLRVHKAARSCPECGALNARPHDEECPADPRCQEATRRPAQAPADPPRRTA